ncbi:MAG: family glycosyltransferase, 4-amino-4-deoxy-L-arabinose transferase [Labilithrix sp.]|nr:family glycosyltransferase, 4-amino-4-deoxy-L-arabinose transferase [Labilithrix sp.]
MLLRALKFLEQRFTAVVLVLAVVQAAALVALRPGVLSVDEVTYLAMARSAAHGAPLVLGDGGLGPSPELASVLVHEVAGRLVAQYPAGYALLAAPFYLALGSRGLFVMSTFAFYGAALLTRRLAARALGSARRGVLAAAVLVLGSFAWEYGAGLWPHALTMLLVTAAVLAAYEDRPLRAGLLTGLAMTVRLDATFLVPALLLLPALRKGAGASWREAAPLLAGLVPGLAFLAATNHLKFGTWMPFSYGPWHPDTSNTGAGAYYRLAVLGLVGLAAAYVGATRPQLLGKRSLVLGALVACVLALALPGTRDALARFGDGLRQLLLDLRFRELDAYEPALGRSARGAMIYAGTLKKSLAQSLPYLALVPVSLLAARRSPERLRARLAVLVPFLVYLGVFSTFRWHGGMSFNLRYFVPVLPVLAVLAADGLVALARGSSSVMHPLRSADVVALASLGLLLAAGAVLQLPSASLAVAERAVLDAPLLVGAALAVSVAVAALLRGPARARAAAVAYVLGIFAIAMAGVVELTYDAVATARVRAAGHRVAVRVALVAPRGSLLVVDFPDRAALLVEDDDVLATGTLDAYADAERLVRLAASRAQRSFAVMSPAALEKLRAQPGLVVEPPADARDGVLIAELRPAGRD